MLIGFLFVWSSDNLEIFDVLSVVSDDALPEGVSRALGRCQAPSTLAGYSALSLNENATLHQLAAGMFYNTFPEDFSIMAVVRLPGAYCCKQNYLFVICCK